METRETPIARWSAAGTSLPEAVSWVVVALAAATITVVVVLLLVGQLGS